jgi:hypothetical protein
MKRLLLLLGIALTPVASMACTCAMGSACHLLEGSTIFVGKVESKNVADGRRPDGTVSSSMEAQAQFTVLEAFRGVSSRTIQVNTTEGCCMCGYHFEVGETYLVFAYEHEGKLAASSCSSTQPLANATALLRQLRSIRDGNGKATLRGLLGVPDQSQGQRYWLIQPLADIRVKAIGAKGEFAATTDAEGVFEFSSLPEDTYQLEPALQPPFGMDMRVQERLKVEVKSAGDTCTQTIVAQWDGSIAGKIEDSAGNPLSGFLLVQPILGETPDDGPPRGGGGLGIDVGDDGKFELKYLAPGVYDLQFSPKVAGRTLLGVHVRYPGRIELGKGEHRTDVTFVVPAQPASSPK